MSRPLTVAYLVSRFPKLSETFILYEMLELERQGVRVELFALVREREPIMQPGAAEFVARACIVKPLSRAFLAAQWHWLRRRPRRYLATLATAVWGNRRSAKFLLRALVVAPTAAAFARRMDELDIDHIHAHWATHPALAAWVASRLTGRSYSFTAHAHDIFVERAFLDRKLHDAAFAVTISEHNRRLFEGWYGTDAERVDIIHCGVDTSVFRPPAPRDRSGGPLEVVSVATLQPQKGHAVLIAAVGALLDEGMPIRLRLVGEGEERPALEAAVASGGWGRQIELLGRQPRERVAAILAESDVVVQPSIVLPDGKTEGIPVALMEAMASGVPVIATAVSGVPELVQDGRTGRLVPPGDVAALAAALRRVRAEPEATALMAEAGRRRVLESFDLGRETRRLAERFLAMGRRRRVDVPDLDPPGSA